MRRGRSNLPRLLLLLSSLDMRAAVHRKAVPRRRVVLISLTGPQRQVSRMGRRPHAAEDGDEWSSANGYDLSRT